MGARRCASTSVEKGTGVGGGLAGGWPPPGPSLFCPNGLVLSRRTGGGSRIRGRPGPPQRAENPVSPPEATLWRFAPRERLPGGVPGEGGVRRVEEGNANH